MQQFRTSLYLLAAYLFARGHSFTIEHDSKRPHKVFFIFDVTPDLSRLVMEFNGNACIPVQDFVSAINNVKNLMMHEVREVRR